MNTHILFAVIFGFLAGVFVRSFFLIGFATAGFVALLALAALLLAYLDETKRKQLIVIAVVLATFGGGVLRMNGSVLLGDPQLTLQLNKEIVVEGVISEEPDVRESKVRIFLDANELVSAGPDREKPRRDVGAEVAPRGEAFSNGATNTIPISASILVVAPRNTSVKYGDRIRASGLLRTPESFETGIGREFNYPEYLAKDGIGYELAFANVEKAEGDNEANFFKAGASSYPIPS